MGLWGSGRGFNGFMGVWGVVGGGGRGPGMGFLVGF